MTIEDVVRELTVMLDLYPLSPNLPQEILEKVVRLQEDRDMLEFELAHRRAVEAKGKDAR